MTLLTHVEALARRKIQGAMFSLGGGIFLLVGTAFLTIALWLVLAELRDAKFAALVLGLAFVALGFICLGIGRLVSRLRVRHAPPLHGTTRASPLLQLIEGFVVGLDAGRRTRRPPSRH